MSRLIVEQALRVAVPSHRLHVQNIPSHVLVVGVAVLVLLGNVRLVAARRLILKSLVLDFLHVVLVLLDVTHLVALIADRRIQETVHVVDHLFFDLLLLGCLLVTTLLKSVDHLIFRPILTIAIEAEAGSFVYLGISGRLSIFRRWLRLIVLI